MFTTPIQASLGVSFGQEWFFALVTAFPAKFVKVFAGGLGGNWFSESGAELPRNVGKGGIPSRIGNAYQSAFIALIEDFWSARAILRVWGTCFIISFYGIVHG